MITRLYIENFGGLHDKEILLGDGLNIIYGRNESGKTTISAFIRAMLYGVDTERRRDIRGNMRKRYTPSSGAIMSGVLETEELVIKRSFGTSARFDTYNAVNRFTGESIPPEDIGYAVMGMNEACFCNTFYLSSFDSYPTNEAEMMDRLSDMGYNGEDGASYDKVRSVLDDMAKQYTKRSGIVDDALSQLHMAQEHYEAEKKKKQYYINLRSNYDMLVKKGESAKAELERLQKEKEKLSLQTVELRNRQRELLSDMTDDNKGEKYINPIPAVAAIVFAIIGFMFVFAYKNPLLILCVCAFVPMVICLKMSGIFKGREVNRKKVDTQLAVIERIIAKTGEAENSDIDEKIKKINDFLVECAARTGKAESELKLINIDESAEEKLEVAKNKYDKVSEEKDCINVAKYILTQSYEELRCDFMPEVNKIFSEYFNRLTGGKYHSAAADRDMKVSVINLSGVMSGEYLSGGTLDAAYFALRLALCDKMDSDNEASLVIDDAFLQYDDERVKNTVWMLSELKRQTIYFTCRENFGNVKCNLIKI